MIVSADVCDDGSMPVLSRVIDEADARQLPSLIAEWSDGSETQRWIARALRIDQALLTEGSPIKDPLRFTRLVSTLMVKAA